MVSARAVANSMRESMERVKAAEPVILKLLGGDRIMCVEGSDDEVLRMLDLTCGIDYFHVYDGRGLVRGVASRFQTVSGGRGYDTFTVRKERESGAATEYGKRKLAIAHGGEYPYLTMQAYVDSASGEVVSMGVARTVDIMAFIDAGMATVRRTGSAQVGQATFWVVPWAALSGWGCDVRTYHAA